MKNDPLTIAQEYAKSSDPGQRRNACVALGEIGGAKAIAALCKLSRRDERSEEVRKAAAAGLLAIIEREPTLCEDAVDALLKVIEHDEDERLVEWSIDEARKSTRLRDRLIGAVRARARRATEPGSREKLLRKIVEIGGHDSHYVDELIEIAAEEKDPRSQQELIDLIRLALEAPDAKAPAREAVGVSNEEYALLGQIRRLGVARPVVQGTLRQRVRRAFVARHRFDAGDDAGLLLIFVIAAFAAFLLPFLAWKGLELFAGITLPKDDELLVFCGTATVFAIAAAAFGLPAVRPVGLSADRFAGAVVELVKAGAAGGILGLLAGVASLLTAFRSETPQQDPPFTLLAWCLGLMAAFVLLRALTILIYGLHRWKGLRALVAALLAPLAMITLTVVAVYIVGLLKPDASASEAVVELTRFMPAALTLTIGYLCIDLREHDALPVDARAWRWPLTAGLVMPALLILGLIAFHPNVHLTNEELADIAREAKDKKILKRHVNFLPAMKYQFDIAEQRTSEIRISFESARISVPLINRIEGSEREGLAFNQDSDGAFYINLAAGKYDLEFLRQADSDRLAGSSQIHSDGAAGSAAQVLLVKLWLSVTQFNLDWFSKLIIATRKEPDDVFKEQITDEAREINIPDELLDLLAKENILVIVDKIVFNARSVNQSHYETTRRFLEGLVSDAKSRSGYYLLQNDASGTGYAAGSLLEIEFSNAGRSAEIRPVVAWKGAKPNAAVPDVAALVSVPGDKLAEAIRDLPSVNRVHARTWPTDPVIDIRRALRLSEKNGEPESLVSKLEQLTPIDPAKEEQLALYLGGDPRAPVGPGTLVRLLGTYQPGPLLDGTYRRDGWQLIEFVDGTAERLDGQFSRAEVPYALVREDLLGGVKDEAAGRELAKELQALLEDFGALLPERMAQVGDVAEAKVQSQAERSTLQAAARRLAARGAWVQRDGVMLFEEPETFTHYFLLPEDGISFRTGDIVRGMNWDFSWWPLFEKVEGDGPAYGAESLHNLVPLGAEMATEEWRVLADGVRQLQASGFARPAADEGLRQRAKDVIGSRGAWASEINLRGDQPPIFRHYFMAINDGRFGCGSIVQGRQWDRDEIPGFKQVFGWGPAEDFLFTRTDNLSHLGPDYNPDWEWLAFEVRHMHCGDDPSP